MTIYIKSFQKNIYCTTKTRYMCGNMEEPKFKAKISVGGFQICNIVAMNFYIPNFI